MIDAVASGLKLVTVAHEQQVVGKLSVRAHGSSSSVPVETSSSLIVGRLARQQRRPFDERRPDGTVGSFGGPGRALGSVVGRWAPHVCSADGGRVAPPVAAPVARSTSIQALQVPFGR